MLSRFTRKSVDIFSYSGPSGTLGFGGRKLNDGKGGATCRGCQSCCSFHLFS